MRKLRLFHKTFIYTFAVMLLITLIAHGVIYLLAPHMTLEADRIEHGSAIIEYSLNSEPMIRAAISRALPISLICCAAAALICSLIFSRAMTIPIMRIARSTERMAHLDRQASCPVHSQDELGMLAMRINALYSSLLSTIDHMAEDKLRASKADKAKLDMLRAASHELKTPVTALSVMLENMILGVGKYKERDTYLVQCLSMVEQLSHMIKEILDASRFDAASEKNRAETFDLARRLPAICEPYRLIALSSGLEFALDTVQECIVHLPPDSLEKILSNLLSNAACYTSPGGRIHVRLNSDSIVIENQCTPIPPEKLAHVFEPFYRPDFARDRRDGGNGLGLYIVDTLASALELRYSFAAMDAPPGMRFTLWLS